MKDQKDSQGKIVFIIEDEEILSSVCKRRLEQEGFRVIEHARGEGSIEMIRNEKPNLVLLDIMLPDVDGYDILKKIKEDKDLKDLPVIMFTNLSQERDVAKAKKLRADDYIIKANFTMKEITQIVKNHVNRN